MRKPKPKPDVMRALEKARQSKQKLIQRSVKSLRTEARQSIAQTRGAILDALGDDDDEEIDSRTRGLILLFFRHSMLIAVGRLALHLSQLSEAVQRNAIRSFSEDIKSLLGIDPRAKYDENLLVRRLREGLEEMHHQSLTRLSSRLVQQAEQEVSQSVLKKETNAEAIKRLSSMQKDNLWQLDRIANTELSLAHNASTVDAIEHSRIAGLWIRWQELVDDATGNPLDDRVAVDSLAITSQITRPGSVFTMPATALVPDAKGKIQVPAILVGKSWAYPPNRPNDRSHLEFWMKDWNIPGWIYRAGERDWVVRR